MNRLGPDFKAEQSKHVDVILSPDMMYSASSAPMVGKLGKSSGKQEFMLPAGARMDHYAYALLRDRSTGTVIGMAKLPAVGMMDRGGMMKHDSGTTMKRSDGGRR